MYLFSKQVVEFCDELYGSGVRSPHLLAFLIDMYEEKCLRVPPKPSDDIELLANKLTELCNSMITEHDIIRAKYWDYVKNKFNIAFERIKLKDSNCRTNNSDNVTNDTSDEASMAQ